MLRPEMDEAQMRRLFAVPDPVPPSLRARVLGWLVGEMWGNRGRWLWVLVDYTVVVGLMFLLDLAVHETRGYTLWSLFGAALGTFRVRWAWHEHMREHDDDRDR